MKFSVILTFAASHFNLLYNGTPSKCRSFRSPGKDLVVINISKKSLKSAKSSVGSSLQDPLVLQVPQG
jgi:hypothetical protein